MGGWICLNLIVEGKRFLINKTDYGIRTVCGI